MRFGWKSIRAARTMPPTTSNASGLGPEGLDDDGIDRVHAQLASRIPHRELYQFDKRVVNATNILPQIFQKEFIPAKPPADWKVIEEKYQEPQAQPPADQPRVAQPPHPARRY